MANPVHTPTPTQVRKDRSLHLFPVAGIPLRLDPTWFVIFVLLLVGLSAGYFPEKAPEATTLAHWSAGLLATLLLFASIVVHELAHALVARHHGIPVPEIRLFLFGGVSRMGSEPTEPKVEFQVAIAGPLTSFAIAVVAGSLAWILPESPWMLATILAYLGWINLLLGLFNLLPGYPLDGGRVLRSLVWWRTGDLRKATAIATGAGQTLALALMLLGGFQILFVGLLSGVWLILLGLLLRGLAKHGYEDLIVRRALEGESVRRVMVPRSELVCAPPETRLDELRDDYLLTHCIRGLPVVSEGRAIGLVGIEDLRGVPREEWSERTVRDVMTPVSDEVTIAPDDSLVGVLERLGPDRPRLLVLRDGELDGLISSSSLARFVELASSSETT